MATPIAGIVAVEPAMSAEVVVDGVALGCRSDAAGDRVSSSEGGCELLIKALRFIREQEQDLEQERWASDRLGLVLLGGHEPVTQCHTSLR